jgi:predicted nuclease with TOPRIM domain
MRPEEEYQNLKREHIDLQMKFLLITNNERLLQETINNAKILIEEKNQLKEENEKLMEENKILRKKIAELEEKNTSLEEQLNSQNKRMSVLEKDIEELKSRDIPITIREGFSALEQYIFADILGSNFSKAKVRKIQSTHNLFKNASYNKECKQFLKNNGLTEDHIYLIPDLKKVEIYQHIIDLLFYVLNLKKMHY